MEKEIENIYQNREYFENSEENYQEFMKKVKDGVLFKMEKYVIQKFWQFQQLNEKEEEIGIKYILRKRNMMKNLKVEVKYNVKRNGFGLFAVQYVKSIEEITKEKASKEINERNVEILKMY